MIKELAEIIEIFEVSDPAAQRLRKLVLALYRDDKFLKLKEEIGSQYYKFKDNIPHTNSRNETQEFGAISYLFGACINFQDKNYVGAVDAASYALAMFRQISKGRTLNESLAHWFLGILHRLVNDHLSAIEEFKEATNIFGELMHIFERESDYNRANYCVKLRSQIAARVPHGQFSEIIDRLIIIPESDPQLFRWWAAIRDTEPSHLEAIYSNIQKLNNILVPETEESASAIPFDIIFLAHCFNLGFYSKEGPLEYQEFALLTATEGLDDYIGNMDNYNQSISHVYIAFLYYNIFDVRNGLLHLKKAYDLLGRLLKENNDIDIKYLQIKLPGWINQFETEVMDRYYETPESRGIQHPKVGILEKIITPFKHTRDSTSAPESSLPPGRKKSPVPEFTGLTNLEKSSKPETTPFATSRRKEADTSFPRLVPENNTQLHGQTEHPKTPGVSSSDAKNESNIRLLVIPVDMNILEKTESYDSPIGHDLFEKLETFDKKYVDLKGNSHPGFSKRVAQPRIIIPSYPIRGQATANPKGEAELPTIDGSQPDLANAVDETMKLKIQNHTYEVFIKQGIQEIKGNNYDWFQVEGNSMDNAEPIPIENEDFVLVHKKKCNPKLCDGQIVLVSVRDNNIDPTRLMVKRFVFMSPKRQPNLEVTTPLLLSESRSRIKEIVITEEYQIEGEVVAIAKLIDE